MEWESWEKYRADGYNTSLRLVGGSVINADDQPVARILTGAGEGQRVEYGDQNRRNLRLVNLIIKPGKGGPRPRPPVKETETILVPVEMLDDRILKGGKANEYEEIPFGFHDVDLAADNDNGKLTDWVKSVALDGVTIRDLDVAKKEIFQMKERRRRNKPLRGDSYHKVTGGKTKGGKVKRFSKDGFK